MYVAAAGHENNSTCRVKVELRENMKADVHRWVPDWHKQNGLVS